jgi:hypothetical protein
VGKRKKQAYIALWTDKQTKAALTQRAKELGVPRAIYLENILRSAIGLPPVDTAAQTPRKYFKGNAGE